MRSHLAVLLLALLATPILSQVHHDAADDDGIDDFAQFDDFEDNTEDNVPAGGSLNLDKPDASNDKDDSEFSNVYRNDDDDDDGVVEDEEFEHFKDEEEFEGFSKTETVTPSAPVDENSGEPKLTMVKVPLHFRTHWDSYWMEMIMMAGLLAYFANYLMGKNKNSRLANLWLSTHKSLLDDNFTLVGDDGKLENESTPGFMKESESLYTLWCSGRTCCEGMLVELKMAKRQDLIAILSDLLKPTQDQIHVKVDISKDVMDPFVFCVASKRTASKFFKEMYDLNKFCTLVNNPEVKYNVPAGFSVLSEIPEASAAILDSRVLLALKKFAHLIDYIYITDQYNGAIQQEDANAALKMPDVRKKLLVGFNLPNASDMESAKALLVLVFYLLEKLKRYRLSKEGKNKADKNRQRVEEEFLKSTHSARAEAAAVRREEKRKQEKERVMAEEDPEKQRRWEKKEQKREQKRKAPKMKQLSVKAL